MSKGSKNKEKKRMEGRKYAPFVKIIVSDDACLLGCCAL
jgi:hypothetical protein